MSALDTQIGGGHYKGMKIQPMEYSMANRLDACQHTAIKYISRFRDKGGIQDLEKAKHCIDMLIEFEQQKEKEKIDQWMPSRPESGPLVMVGGLSVPLLWAKNVGLVTEEGERTDAGKEFEQNNSVVVSEDPYGPRDAEGWYAWNGDEAIRPAGKVDVGFRNGLKSYDHAASDLLWKNYPGDADNDIVKWRPAQ